MMESLTLINSNITLATAYWHVDFTYYAILVFNLDIVEVSFFH